MDSNKVKSKLTQEKIISLCCHLQGFDDYFWDSQGHPIFNTCLDHPDDGGSFKLYYYQETKLFHVYTRGESYDVFELVRRALKLETFKQAFDYIVKFFHFRSVGFDEEEENTEDLLSDWDIFQKTIDYSEEKKSNIPDLVPVQENMIEYFYPLAAPEEWIKEGISCEVMYRYGIRIDSALSKIIIPHRDIDGNLVGIRGRSFNPVEILEGKKYMPVFIEGEMYNHPLGKNLYGLNYNKETIKKLKKVCVFEAEKSVLQIASYYGLDSCFAVATCGSSFSQDQMDLLLSLGVSEVILAYDHDCDAPRDSEEMKKQEDKLRKIITPLLPYVNVSIIMDYDNITPLKASPSDCGKEVFEKLYKSRIRLHSYDEQMRKEKRNSYGKKI